MRNGLIAIEGPPTTGKARLAAYLAGQRGARQVIERTNENPFIKLFQKDRERYSFATQMSFVNSRFQALRDLGKRYLFHDLVVTDFTWQRNFIYANLLLGEHELELFENIVHQFRSSLPTPDLIIYLQSDPYYLRAKGSGFDSTTMTNLVMAYDHFFFHYDDSPVLIVRLDNYNLDNELSLKEIDSFIEKDIKGTVYLTGGGGLFR